MFERYANQLRDWFYRNAEGKRAPLWLSVISFLESSFFPIPPDPFLMAVLMVKREKWLHYSLLVSVFSVLGAMFGYLIGYAFFETIGVFIVNLYSLQDELLKITELFQNNLSLTMFTAAFTPIPFKMFTISAGLFKVNFFIFVIASFVGRAMRFLIVGYVMKIFGKQVGDVFFKKFNLLTMIVVVVVVFYILIKMFL